MFSSTTSVAWRAPNLRTSFFAASVDRATCDDDCRADIAGGVGVAIHLAREFVELRAPRLEARTLNAEDGLRAIEIGVTERIAQSIQSATSQTLVASLRLLVRRRSTLYGQFSQRSSVCLRGVSYFCSFADSMPLG
jgi:hypothetical protein